MSGPPKPNRPRLYLVASAGVGRTERGGAQRGEGQYSRPPPASFAYVERRAESLGRRGYSAPWTVWALAGPTSLSTSLPRWYCARLIARAARRGQLDAWSAPR
jgi:hypothetical protein